MAAADSSSWDEVCLQAEGRRDISLVESANRSNWQSYQTLELSSALRELARRDLTHGNVDLEENMNIANTKVGDDCFGEDDMLGRSSIASTDLAEGDAASEDASSTSSELSAPVTPRERIYILHGDRSPPPAPRRGLNDKIELHMFSECMKEAPNWPTLPRAGSS